MRRSVAWNTQANLLKGNNGQDQSEFLMMMSAMLLMMMLTMMVVMMTMVVVMKTQSQV